MGMGLIVKSGNGVITNVWTHMVLLPLIDSDQEGVACSRDQLDKDHKLEKEKT